MRVWLQYLWSVLSETAREIHHRLIGLKRVKKSCYLSSCKAESAIPAILHDRYFSNLISKSLQSWRQGCIFSSSSLQQPFIFSGSSPCNCLIWVSLATKLSHCFAIHTWWVGKTFFFCGATYRRYYTYCIPSHKLSF